MLINLDTPCGLKKYKHFKEFNTYVSSIVFKGANSSNIKKIVEHVI